MTLDELLQNAIESGASDLHLYAGYPPTVRVAGQLQPADPGLPPLTDAETEELIAELVGREALSAWREDPMPMINLAHHGPGGSLFRTTIHRFVGRPGAALRCLPSKVPTPAEIGLPSVLERVVDAPHGVVIVTGPMGSGKTTTLYSLVEAINTKHAVHIVTLSDPLDYVLQPKRGLVRQIEIGTDVRSFPEAARAVLREDPDVIVVGEMRDLETVSLTLTLAETGHLVFTQMHCRTAAEACSRIVDVFPPTQQEMTARMLAANLCCVISQRLFLRADRPGRTAAYEIMFATDEVRGLVEARRFAELPGAIEASRGAGMQTMQQHVEELVAQGVVKRESAECILGGEPA